MPTFRVFFERWGYVDVKADTKEEAEEIAYGEEVESEDGWEMVDRTKILWEEEDD